MSINVFLWAAALSILPISELRGSIPYLHFEGGVDLIAAAAICIALNALVAPIAFLFLNTIHKLLIKIGGYKKLFEGFVERKRKGMEKPLQKYGYWGICLFVAIPLPLTGAWTGALAAWLFGMKQGKAMLFIMLGVLIAGIIVTSVIGFGVTALSFFVK